LRSLVKPDREADPGRVPPPEAPGRVSTKGFGLGDGVEGTRDMDMALKGRIMPAPRERDALGSREAQGGGDEELGRREEEWRGGLVLAAEA